jgi:type IV pilus assembly protein PilC
MAMARFETVQYLENIVLRVRREQLIDFSRQLAGAIAAGWPIIDALEVITAQTSDRLLQKALAGVTGAMRTGDSFTAAAAAHPEAFPGFYVEILRSAESTGHLDTVLNRLAYCLEWDVGARRRVISELKDSGMAILAILLAAWIVLTGWVLPKFRDFFNSLGAKVPLPTRLLLGFDHFVTSWWFVMFSGLLALVASAIVAVRTPPIREKLDAILLKVLLTGDLLCYGMTLPLGESNETLNQQLYPAAVYYAHQLDDRIKRRRGALEPALLISIGLVIGFSALAIISAMYGISQQVRV